jgi:hypothetical protein
MDRTYEGLMELETFEERFEYLKLEGKPGFPTFGHERWMNQKFYRSAEWRHIRNFIIARDQAFDLGARDRPIPGKIMIHHMVPLTPDALTHSDDTVMDPNYLISCSMRTHNAIHYGDASLVELPTQRRPNDTAPWLH